MKKSKQQSRKKINRRGERRVVNTKAATGFPDSEIATIKYSDEVSLSGGLYAQYTFRGNSAFDPDETGIGHQPMYFDQYAAVYSKYKVIASACRVTASNYNAAASASVVVIPSSEIVTITSYSIAMEQPYAKRTELLPISTRMGSQSTISSSATTRRILGLSSAQFASEDYSALVGATPASVWYWNIAAFDASAVSIRFLVDLTYRVLFYDRKAPSPSRVLLVSKTEEEQAKRKRAIDPPLVVNYVAPVDPPRSLRRNSL